MFINMKHGATFLIPHWGYPFQWRLCLYHRNNGKSNMLVENFWEYLICLNYLAWIDWSRLSLQVPRFSLWFWVFFVTLTQQTHIFLFYLGLWDNSSIIMFDIMVTIIIEIWLPCDKINQNFKNNTALKVFSNWDKMTTS